MAQRGMLWLLTGLIAMCGVVAWETAVAGQESPARLPSDDARVIAGTIIVGDVTAERLRRRSSDCHGGPKRIVMVGPKTVTPELQAQIRGLDAFVPVGSDVIYLKRQSPTVREAELSGGPYLFMLALVIWHEMAHVDGLDELGARRREEEMWKQFLQGGEVDSAIGMAYLAELRNRK